MNTNLNMKRMPIDRLKPAKYNPRKDLQPGDPAYEKIKRSLHDFGYVDPIVWNEVTGNIVGGHQRYKVLVNEGATEVDCVVVHIKNPQDEKALNIALNKATGDWEPMALADLLQDLQLSGYDLGATGFDAAEVDDLFSKVHDKETKEDDFDVEEELKQPAFSHKGDIWHLGRHVVLCGDSTLAESYEQLLSGTKANMILSDLPYFVAYHGTAGTIQNDNLPDAEALEFTLKAMRCMYNALADDGSIYIFHADTKGLIFRKAFDEAGFYLSGCCIWKKNSLVLGRSPYQWMHEPCLFGWKKDGKHRWYSDRKQTTVWEYDRPKSSKEHPTMKPVGLMAYPIRNSTMTNGIVLDPFLGSGSTLIACDEIDRICMGIEIDEKFVDVICKRYIESHEGRSDDVYVIRDGEKLQYADVVKEPLEETGT